MAVAVVIMAILVFAVGFTLRLRMWVRKLKQGPINMDPGGLVPYYMGLGDAIIDALMWPILFPMDVVGGLWGKLPKWARGDYEYEDPVIKALKDRIKRNQQ